MPTYAIITTFLRPIEEVRAALPGHRDWVRQAIADEILLLSGPQSPHTGGVMLAHRVAREELDARLATDSFVAMGVARHDVYEVSVRRADPRLEFLVDPHHAHGPGGPARHG